MSNRIKLQDVAAAAGVSKCTASLALRDSRKVAEKTRKRVGSVARDLGYERDAAAAVMAGRRVRHRKEAGRFRIGVLDNKSWNLASNNSDGFELVSLSFPGKGVLATSLRTWWHRGIVGLIINTRGIGTRTWLKEVQRHRGLLDKFCIVTLGPSSFSCVRDSPTRMMIEALDRTVAAGYQRIAVLLGEDDQKEDNTARLGAALVAQEEAPDGVDIECKRYPLSGSEIPQEVLHWLRERRPDAAILFPGGNYHYLHAEGYSFPEDLGFCGVPMPADTASEELGLSGPYTIEEDFQNAALELMEQLLRLGLRGVLEHPVVRVMDTVWRKGETL